MTNDKPQKWLLHEPVRTEFARIIPALAMEIGLNESIVLIHISYWLSISNNVKDGRYWTWQTLRDMQEKVFPYWSIETIRRAIQSLQVQGYINIGNFNERKNDRTQWFALEPNKCSELKSVIILPVNNEITVSKRDRLSQNETAISQIETTLPEITTENIKDYASDDAVETPLREKQKRERTPNPIFDAVALGSFQLTQVNGDKQAGARIGKIVAWLKDKPDATCERVTMFYKWYRHCNADTSAPRDVAKFAEWWLKFDEAVQKRDAQPEPTNDLSVAIDFKPLLQRSYEGQQS